MEKKVKTNYLYLLNYEKFTMKLKHVLLPLIIFLCNIPANSQKKTFNGEIKIAIKVTSKCPGISDEEWKESMLFNDTVVHLHSGFNYKETFNEYTYYSLSDSNKDFTVFKNIDSLYQGWYSSNQQKENITIDRIPIDSLVHGYKCYKYIISSEYSKTEFTLLDSTLYNNGKKVYLTYYYESPFLSIVSDAISIEEKLIDSQAFVIPSYPLSPLKNSEISHRIYSIPEFEGGNEGWQNYIQNNARTRLGTKYIKIPEGQTTGMQSVKIIFALDSNGNVVKSVPIMAANMHPKLVKEALRLINNSPTWKNALYHNKGIPFTFSQKITFASSNE